MKNAFKKGIVTFAALAALAGCSSKSAGTSAAAQAENKVITIGATEVPHAQILEDVVAPLLEKDGWTLEVTVFQDYVQPNTAVEENELDANYFQTIRYLDEQNEERNLHLKSVAGVHLEPMGVFSEKITSLDDLKDGASIAIPNDGSNESRALKLLEDNGLIELDHSKNLYDEDDVVSNPHNYEFVLVAAENLTHSLPDVDIALINGNYALQAELDPKDALAAEQADGPDAHYYINYLVVKEGNEATDKTKALQVALQSDEVEKYIEDNYSGSVIPAFTDGEGNVLSK